MQPYRGRTPRRLQGPQDDPGGGWLACLAFVIVVLCIVLAALESTILRVIGW